MIRYVNYLLDLKTLSQVIIQPGHILPVTKDEILQLFFKILL